MTDSQAPSPQRASASGGIYPTSPPTATSSLEEILRERIRSRGPLGFSEFMETALYHPMLGYYAQHSAQTGKSGDFFTSVSVGPLFGQLLARRMLRHWQKSGQPGRWRIIELGAHDGTLARDILTTLHLLGPRAFHSLEYVIPEPLPALQKAQQKTLAGFKNQTRLISNLSSLAADPLPGLAFGNEVLDALPFHRVCLSKGHWHEQTVTLSPEMHFTWSQREIADARLSESLDGPTDHLPEGYLTEIRTCISDFLTPIAEALVHGLMIWIDYGFARPEFRHPDRNTGTLRTYHRHKAGENPLERFGEIDISAHVDFTDVAQQATAIGGRPLRFQSQGSWLLENAREWLLEQEGIPDNPLLRQFQTLTHPSHLGAQFHVIELTWDPQRHPKDPASLRHRLALR